MSVASFGTSVSDQSRESDVSRAGDGDGEADLLDANSNFRAALYGVLYTLQKDKLDHNYKFVIFKLLMEFLQIFVLIVSPQMDWDVSYSHWPWRAMNLVQIKNFATAKKYGDFNIAVFMIAVLLGISLGGCVWAGWSFRNDRSTPQWPLKVLRLLITVLFVTFHLALFTLLMVPLDCHVFNKDKSIKNHLEAFPKVECFAMPHIAILALSLVLAILMTLLTACFILTGFELDPLHRGWLASAHSLAELWLMFVKIVVSISVMLIGDYRLQQALLILVALVLGVWALIRWVPHYNIWVQHVRSGMYGALSWVALIQVLLVYAVPDHIEPEEVRHVEHKKHQLTVMMYIGLAPFFLLTSGISWLRLWWCVTTTYKALRDMKPDEKFKKVCRFTDIYEVEIASRCCRFWVDDDTVDSEHARVAELVIKAGLAQFPNDAFITVVYANFLTVVQVNPQSGHAQIQAARKLNPPVTLQYVIFVREQEHRKKAQQGGGTGESSLDMVGYIEFQRNFRQVSRAHKAALQAARSFWKQLLHHEISFRAIISIFKRMESTATVAERTYKMVLDRYPASEKLLRSYAQFLQDVKNDPWAAQKYQTEAEKIQGRQANTQEGEAEDNADDWKHGDDMVLSKVDEKTNALIVINTSGIIQTASRLAQVMFGYKKGELEGKNVAILMPQPFSSKHNMFLKNYVTTGVTKIVGSVRDVVAVHKDGYIFPTKLVIQKVSGSGADALFMGVFKPADEDLTLAKLYAGPEGNVICADQQFNTLFGKAAVDCNGKKVSSLVLEQDKVTAMLAKAHEMPREEFADGKYCMDVHVHHKFLSPIDATITVNLGGSDAMRIFIIAFKPKDANLLSTMVVDSKGHVQWVDAGMGRILGYTPAEMLKLPMAHFMPKPFGPLHASLLKDASASARVPAGSCRSSSTVLMLTANNVNQPVKMRIESKQQPDETMVHLIHVEKSSVEEALDERRMSLLLDHNGTVVQVLSSSKASIFGFPVTQLQDKNVTSFVDVFGELQEHPDQNLSTVMAMMLGVEEMLPGRSYRVGVHKPDAGSDKAPGVMLMQQTKPAVMQLTTREEEDGQMRLVLDLWRVDMLTGVIEVNGQAGVARLGIGALYAPHLIFGVSASEMDRASLSQFITADRDITTEWLLDDGTSKNSVLKAAAKKGELIGQLRKLPGVHVDGAPLQLSVQAVSRDGNAGSRRAVLKVAVVNPRKGDLQSLLATLNSVLKDNPAASHMLMKLDSGSRRDYKEDTASASIQRSNSRLGPVVKAPALLGPATDAADSPSEHRRVRWQGLGDGPRPATGVTEAHHDYAPTAPPSQRSLGVSEDSDEEPAAGQPDVLHVEEEQGDYVTQKSMALTEIATKSIGKVDNKKRMANWISQSAEQVAQGAVEHGEDLPLLSAAALDSSAPPAPAHHARNIQRKGTGPLTKKAGFAAVDDDLDALERPESPDADITVKAKVGKEPSFDTPKKQRKQSLVKDADASSEGTRSENDGDAVETGSAKESSVEDRDEGGEINYRRAKRFKKLLRMLANTRLRQQLVTVTWASYLLIGVVVAIHVACYVTMKVNIDRQNTFVEDLEASVWSSAAMYDVATYSRTLQQLHLGASAVDVYGPADVQKYEDLVQAQIKDFRTRAHGIYLGFKGIRHLSKHSMVKLLMMSPCPSNLSVLNDTTTPPHVDMEQTGMWEGSQLFIASAREIIHSHKTWADAVGDISVKPDWWYVVRNGPRALYDAWTGMVDASTLQGQDAIASLKKISIIMLVLEGCVVSAIGIAYVWHLMRRIEHERYDMLAIFLTIPGGFVRTLAFKEIVLITDDDGDGDSENGRDVQAAATAQEKDDKDKEEGDEKGKASNTSGKQHTVQAKAFVGLAQKPTAGAENEVPQTTTAKWLTYGGNILRLCLGLSRTSSGKASKRHLLQNGSDAKVISLSFMTWACLVILFYAIGTNLIASQKDGIINLRITYRQAVHIARLYHFSQEFVTVPPTERAVAQKELLSAIDKMEFSYHLMVYGGVLPSTLALLHNASWATAGTTFLEPQNADLLFRKPYQCWDPDCLNITSPFYMLRRFGLDIMTTRATRQARLLAHENSTNINLQNQRFRYIWRIGTEDYNVAIKAYAADMKSYVKNVFKTVDNLHVGLFILCWFLSCAFIAFLLRPFIKQATGEARRMADLLSQLPAEVNAEQLLQLAMRKGIGQDELQAK